MRLDVIDILCVEAKYQGKNWSNSSVSTHMTYVANKQISELKDYFEIKPKIETLS